MTDVLADANYLLHPIWDAERNAAFGFLCEPFWDLGNGPRPEGRLSPETDTRNFRAAVDLQTLDVAVRWVEEALAAFAAPVVVVPVHAETLADDVHAERYAARVHEHLAAIIDDVFFEVVVSEPLPQGGDDTVVRAMNRAAPLSRGVMLRLPFATPELPATGGWSLTSVGIEAGAGDDQAVIARLEDFAGAGREFDLGLHVHGLRGAVQTEAAFQLGYRYIGSDIFGAALEPTQAPEDGMMTPEHIMKLLAMAREAGGR